MRVEVLPEDIAEGHPGSYFACPVALAVRRASGARYVCVSGALVMYGEFDAAADFGTGDSLKRTDVPAIVAMLIARYDMIGEMDPFGFEL